MIQQKKNKVRGGALTYSPTTSSSSVSPITTTGKVRIRQNKTGSKGVAVERQKKKQKNKKIHDAVDNDSRVEVNEYEKYKGIISTDRNSYDSFLKAFYEIDGSNITSEIDEDDNDYSSSEYFD